MATKKLPEGTAAKVFRGNEKLAERLRRLPKHETVFAHDRKNYRHSAITGYATMTGVQLHVHTVNAYGTIETQTVHVPDAMIPGMIEGLQRPGFQIGDAPEQRLLVAKQDDGLIERG